MPHPDGAVEDARAGISELREQGVREGVLFVSLGFFPSPRRTFCFVLVFLYLFIFFFF